MPPPDDARGTLDPAEPHPASHQAASWLARRLAVSAGMDASMLAEAFASTAIEGNRLGEVAGETLRRFRAGEPVSDRYLLGLCWAIREIDERRRREARE